MFSLILFFIPIVIFAHFAHSDYTDAVQTSSGRIQGVVREIKFLRSVGRHRTRADRALIGTYTGIPFGKILPSSRFAPATPINESDSIVNATNAAPSCYQPVDQNFNRFDGVEMWNSPNNYTQMSEDCLYLNVYAPIKCTNSSCAVVVWVFGGYFNTGTLREHIFEGPFGFLYLRSKRAPGNVGLKDQRLALQWIKANIKSFGGDPHSITLMGESAGAMSISYHLQSQQSWPLFERAILQSGNFYTPQAFQHPSEAFNNSLEFAYNVGCIFEEIDNVIECLNDVPPLALIDAMLRLKCDNTLCMQFVPTLDCDNFIKECPGATLTASKNVMLGINANEATSFLVYALNSFYKREENLNFDLWMDKASHMTEQTFMKFLDFLLAETNDQPHAIRYFCSGLKYTPQTQIVEEVDNKSMSSAYFTMLDRCLSDYLINCPALKLTDELTSDPNRKVYLYHFNYRSKVNPWPQWMGVIHGYEIDFVFGTFLRVNHTAADIADIRLSEQVMQYWSSFIKNSNPNMEPILIKWPAYDKRTRLYLDIGPRVRVKKEYRSSECYWWNDLFPLLRYQRKNQLQRCSASATLTTSRHYILVIFVICTLLHMTC